jgi:hypothetical protein
MLPADRDWIGRQAPFREKPTEQVCSLRMDPLGLGARFSASSERRNESSSAA